MLDLKIKFLLFVAMNIRKALYERKKIGESFINFKKTLGFFIGQIAVSAYTGKQVSRMCSEVSGKYLN